MVSLVIVSHSATLAEGVRELAAQMVQGQVPMAVAGGVDDPDNPIGTDPMRVVAAIESVYQPDGVVVLMDLGSALMSAEMALEFIDPAWQPHVFLCEAPLVEGAVAAAVQAMTGGTPEAVMDEARGALAAKRSQLAPLLGAVTDEAPADAAAPADLAAGVDSAESPDALTLTVVIPNRLGLHARPAALLVSAAGRFSADITLTRQGRTVNAKSMNQVATLGARQGDSVTVRAAGPDAAAALAAIEALAADNFGDAVDTLPADVPAPPATTTATEAGALRGIAAAPGVAVGPAWRLRAAWPAFVDAAVDDPEHEWKRLHAAIQEAVGDLVEVERTARRSVGSAESAIFDAHRLILQDPELHRQARERLADSGRNAEAVWKAVIDATAAGYRALDDAYLRARAVDVEDAGRRVMRHLTGSDAAAPVVDRPSIVVAGELAPSDTAQLDPELVLGIITELGGATGHSAILARALGIPAVVGAGGAASAIADGQVIGLDGTRGLIWPQPDDARQAALQAERESWLATQRAAKVRGQEPAVTADGLRIEVAANIGGPQDAAVAVEYGAEAVGLFRTEFLFMDRGSAPGEAEQYAAYSTAAHALDGRPLIIRTLDVGGDKPIAYLNIEAEHNPFLGWRGLRYCLDSPEIFVPQLRAICRTSADFPVRLMFPMVSNVDEVRRARALLASVQADLAAAGLPFNPQMPVGIMIEVPSAVTVADQLAAEVDFFSIGTNDLTQYLMAADRGNARVAGLANALQPAVLRAVRQTVQAAHGAGIWVGMCGELAGNPLATPVLVGLGLDELSMSAPSIPAVKAAVRALTLDDARAVADGVLGLDSAESVTRYLESHAAG